MEPATSPEQPPPLPPPLPDALEPATVAAGVGAPPGAERGRLWAEIGVMLALAVLPDLAGALSAASHAGDSFVLSGSHALRIVLRSVTVCTVLVFIAWRSGEGWSSFGVRKPRLFVDPALGVGLWIGAYICMMIGVYASYAAGLDAWSATEAAMPRRGQLGSIPLIVTALLMNSCAEEFAIWGFLSTRLRRLNFSAVTCVLLPAVVFGSYHVYQSGSAVVGIAASGIVHGVVFRLTGRIWPLVISHTIQNLLILTFYA